MTIKTQLFNGEQVVREGAANMQQGCQAVGGWLYLTNQRLVFENHKLNIGGEGLSMHLVKVTSARPSFTKVLCLIPLVPNAFTVSINNGQDHQFIVHGRRKWIEAIEQVTG